MWWASRETRERRSVERSGGPAGRAGTQDGLCGGEARVVRVDEFSHEADEESFAMRTALLLCFLWAAAAFEPRPAAPCSTPSLRRRAYSPVQPRSAALAASAVARRAVVTDMDETLIKSKSTLSHTLPKTRRIHMVVNGLLHAVKTTTSRPDCTCLGCRHPPRFPCCRTSRRASQFDPKSRTGHTCRRPVPPPGTSPAAGCRRSARLITYYW